MTSKDEGKDGSLPFDCETKYRDHIQLKGLHWPSIKQPCRAVLLIMHGSGEHCRRYKHMAIFYREHGFAVVAFDMRGHGHSDGERGFAPHLDALFDDFESMIQRVRKEYPEGAPLVIFSHGTGSLFCLGHIVRRKSQPFDCQAMILSASSVCLKRRPSVIVFWLARVFAHLHPHMTLPAHGNESNRYTNNADVVEDYRNDDLVHDRWTAAVLAMFLELGIMMENNNIETSWPLLIQHGDKDGTAPIERIRVWVRDRTQAYSEAQEKVTFKEWPGHFHEIHNDLGKEEVFDYMLEWICTKLHLPHHEAVKKVDTD